MTAQHVYTAILLTIALIAWMATFDTAQQYLKGQDMDNDDKDFLLLLLIITTAFLTITAIAIFAT